MEKMLKPYDKEYMKMAMLKHEETFKQQVYELHRVYRIQKILMKGIDNRRPNGQNQERLNYIREISLNQMINGNHHNFHKKSQKGFNLDQPGEEYITELHSNGVLEIQDESEIQLTLGPTNYYRKKNGTPGTSDSGPSFSSSSTGSSHIKGAQGPDISRENLRGRNRGLSVVPADSNTGYHSARNNSFHVQEQSRQDRLNQPPWLLQALSLNMS